MIKRLIIVTLFLMLLLFCSCTSRSQETDEILNNTFSTSNSNETFSRAENNDESLPRGRNASVSSGSCISVSEPMSDMALQTLNGLMQSIENEGAYCGVAFIGCKESEKTIAECIEQYHMLSNMKYDEVYPFMMEMTSSCCACKLYQEVYCLIPQKSVKSVTVQEYGKSGSKSILYYAENSAPLYFSANNNGTEKKAVSVLILLSDNSVFEYFPELDETGKLNDFKGVYDFSLY